MSVDIRRGTARFVDREVGRVTHHAFSFGQHYDTERLAFGPMVCHDDHLLGSGRGFGMHRHSGLEIVSYVVAGALEHTDPSGRRELVPAGSLAHLHTGDGVEHAEHATADGPCRFVQVWLTAPDVAAEGAGEEPGEGAGAPSYRVVGTGGLDVRTRDGAAHLDVVHLDAQQQHDLPAGPLVHAFVATGALTRSSLAEPLGAGDAFLLTGETEAHPVTAAVPTTLLVWTFDTAPERVSR